MNRVQRKIIGLLLALTIVFIASILSEPVVGLETNSSNHHALDRDYWPTDEWQTADPSEVGIDASYLEAMMEYIDDQGHNIHSVIVVHDGYIVWEEYPMDTYNPTKTHMLQSCTKSFTSTLIGIALHEGFIDNVSQKMVDFFPNRTIENLDSRKMNITLYHILTMSEGMYWTEHDYPYTDDRNTLKQMWDSTDAIQHILDQPMVREPGESWHYNSGMSILLGAIIEQVTGQSVESFAEEYLFDRIGIGDYGWISMARSGVLHTDGGLYLSSRNMARLGYLMLNNGTWNGTEIVSQEWVHDATRTQVSISQFMGYGYQWWTYLDQGVYAATGHYEQKIYVVPEDDLVVVFTANIADEDPHPTDSILFTFILPSLDSDYSHFENTRTNLVNLSLAVIVAIPLLVFGAYWLYKMRRL